MSVSRYWYLVHLCWHLLDEPRRLPAVRTDALDRHKAPHTLPSLSGDPSLGEGGVSPTRGSVHESRRAHAADRISYLFASGRHRGNHESLPGAVRRASHGGRYLVPPARRPSGPTWHHQSWRRQPPDRAPPETVPRHRPATASTARARGRRRCACALGATRPQSAWPGRASAFLDTSGCPKRDARRAERD